MAFRFPWKTGKGDHAVRTHTGLVRENNEDAWGALPEAGFFMVADGMGGLSHGEEASRIAVDTVLEAVGGHDGSDQGAMGICLRDAFIEAHERILKHGAEVCPGRTIGTTGVALWLHGDTGLIGHVGDSRLYRLRDGALDQLTADHTLVQEMVDLGRLTPEEAERSPYAHKLTRALGVPRRNEPAIREIDVREGDLFLLCSDGLSGVADREAIRAALAAETLEAMADRLQEEALRGGGPDNITLILVRV